MEKNFNEEWSRAVRAELAVRGMTLEDLGNQIGYTRQYVSAIIHGRVRCGKAQSKISAYLGIPNGNFSIDLKYKQKAG